MTKEEILHILERAGIHFTSATSIVLMVAILLRYIAIATGSSWIPQTLELTLLSSATIVFASMSLREAWDVSKGQKLIKVVTDYVSWALGAGFGAWGLYRWAMFLWSN